MTEAEAQKNLQNANVRYRQAVKAAQDAAKSFDSFGDPKGWAKKKKSLDAEIAAAQADIKQANLDLRAASNPAVVAATERKPA